MLITIISFIIVLCVVVLIHELGHYVAARISGVRVLTFSIGFGPAICKWTDKRGTTWKIACLPLGGYVQLYGNDDIFDRANYKKLTAQQKRGHYLSVSAWRQAFISAAGVIMNFILAFAIYWGLAMRTEIVQLPVIGTVATESVAANAGIKTGDVVVRIGDNAVKSWTDLVGAKEMFAGKSASVAIVRGEKLITMNLPYATTWGIAADAAKTTTIKRGVGAAFVAGARETWAQSKMLAVVIKQIVTGERSSKQLGSFITIAQVSGMAMSAGLAALLSLIALISINLAVINLVPVPVLDGGLLLILAIEGIIRRKLPGRAVQILMTIGWILVGALLLLTMKNDIWRVFGL